MDLFLRESSRTDHATWKFGRPASYRDSRCAMIPEAATRSRRVLGQRRILLFEALPHGHIPARIVFGEGLWTPAGRSYRCSPRYTWTPSRKRRRNDCRRTRGYRVTCICRHGSGSSALCPDPDLLHQLSPSYRAASASVAVDGKAIQLLWTFPCLAKTSFLPPPRPTLSSLHADTDAMSTMTQLDKKAKRTIMRILHTNMDTVSEPSLTEMRVDVVSTPSTHRLMH